MQVQATTETPLSTGADTIVIGLIEGEGIAHDVPGDGLAALLQSGEAKAVLRRVAVTHAEGRRFILVGLGARDRLTPERARAAAAAAHARARELGSERLCWEVPHHVEDAVVQALVEGTLLHAYRFDRYRRTGQDEDGETPPGGPEHLIVSAHHDVSQPVGRGDVLARAQNRARDLANSPPNDLTPAALADYVRELADSSEGLSVTVMDEEEIRAAGMGAFAAVAQGSEQGARLIALDYAGPGAGGPLVALVGKAVTFDSGGISLKPAAKMYEMKFDMSGGAAVIGAMAALAELQAPVRVLGVVGATENMPGGGSVRPGDIVTASDGTTIEINNTDAEGRLVLADCLTFARERGAERMVDVATLTGAVVVALGSVYAGLMSNDDEWAGELVRCGERTGERLWRLPLDPVYARMVRGRYADLTNLTEVREAGSITAAELLHHFAGEVPWVHLDIAGTAWDLRRPYLAKGGSGFGVRTLVEAALAA